MLSLFSWIPELTAEGKSQECLHGAMLKGMDGDARAIEKWVAAARPRRDVAFLVRATTAFLAGRYGDVADELSRVPLKLPREPIEAACRIETLVLRHLVGIRLGEVEAAERLLGDIDDMARRLRRPSVPRVLAIENAARLMGKGFYHAAVRALLALESEFDESALFWLFRIHSLLGTCFQAMGDYERSRAALAAQDRILKQIPSANFRLSRLRRQMSLSWECERYDEAADCWDFYRNDSDYARFPVIHALFLQERLRLHLARHDTHAVEQVFSDLERHVQAHRLARTFLSLIEERAEMTLRARRPDEAVAVLRGTLEEASLRGDLSGLCAVTILHARALALGGKLRDAASALRRALDTAEEQRFGKARVRILLFLAAVLHVLEERVEARSVLVRGLRLAEELDLPVQRACGAVLLRVLEGGAPKLFPLFELQATLRTTREILSYLQFYQAPLQATVRVWTSGSPDCLQWELLDAFSEMARRCLVCLVPSEGFLGSFEGNRTTVLPLGAGEQVSQVVQALFRAAVRSGPPLTVARVHELLWPRVRFRSWHHGHRVHSLMGRVRRLLREVGVDVESVGNPGRYVLRSSAPLAWAEAKKSAARSFSPTPRQQEFLELVRARGCMSTTDVCAEMGLRRQTLHPMVQPLLKAGLVRLHRRGRSSYFSP